MYFGRISSSSASNTLHVNGRGSRATIQQVEGMGCAQLHGLKFNCWAPRVGSPRRARSRAGKAWRPRGLTAIGRDGIRIHVKAWINLEDTVLREINQTQRTGTCGSTYNKSLMLRSMHLKQEKGQSLYYVYFTTIRIILH